MKSKSNKKKHYGGKRHKKMKGGNPAIIPILTAVNEVAKAIKPASRLKQTKLGKVPVLGTILEGLSQMGYGDQLAMAKTMPRPMGQFVTAVDGDMSIYKKRMLPVYPNQGQRSVPAGVRGGGVNLFPY